MILKDPSIPLKASFFICSFFFNPETQSFDT